MTGNKQLKDTLDKTAAPTVIIHEGLFIYANPAFLSLLGYGSLTDLEALPFLDITEELSKEQLKKHLKLAQKTTASSKNKPQLDATFITDNGSTIPCTLHSHAVDFEGENATLCYLDIAGSTKPIASTSSHTITKHSLPSQSKGSGKTILPNDQKKSLWKLCISLFFLTFLTLGPAPLLLHLKINNVPKVYLPENAPAVQIDNKVRELFPNDQGMIFLFEGIALYSDGFLNAFSNLTQTLANRSDIEKVFSITTQDHIQGSDEGFSVEPLIDVEEIAHLNEQERQQRVLADRFARQTLVSPEGDALALITIPVTMDNSLARMSLQDDVIELIDNHGLSNYLSAEAGQITTDIEQTRQFLSQLIQFVPLTVCIGLFLIWLLFRRILAVFTSIIVVSAVVGSTVSLYVLFKVPFNLISSILPTLVTALTIAALVHLYNALQYASIRGKTGSERVAMAMAKIKNPALYNALTTMAGFASLGLSEIPPIKHLGMITAAGVGIVYLVVYHITPQLFIHYDKSKWPIKKGGLNLLDKSVSTFFQFSVRHPIAVITTSLLLIGACLPYLNNIVVETNLQEFFAPHHKTRIATQHIEDKLAGTGSLDILFTASTDEGITEPENLLAIRAFQKWLAKQPEIDKTTSFADFVEEMHWGFHDQQDNYRAIPEDNNLIAQYLFVYDGIDIYDFVDDTYQNTRVSINLTVHGAKDISHLLERIRQYLKENTPENLTWEIAGISRMFADQVDLLITGQVNSMLGALVIIFILMMVQWRSIKASLICMIPNLSPVLLIFIAMGAFNIWLDVATAMIASVAVGIAIDDTIHIYHGFNYRVKKGISPAFAIARTYRHAGRAVTITTTILCTQFLILMFSDFVPIKHFGLLTSIGMAAALIFDLMLLPAILMLCFRTKNTG